MAITDIFDRYDILTTIIPGATFAVAMLVLFAPAGPYDVELSAEVLIVLAVGVFLLGEVLKMFTDTVDPGQRRFAFTLITSETQLELNELHESILDKATDLLEEERETDEDLQEVVRALTHTPWDEEVSSWPSDRQVNWAWAHVLSLIISEPVSYNNDVFDLVKSQSTDPERWISELKWAREGSGDAGVFEELYYEVFSWVGMTSGYHQKQLAEWLTAAYENDQSELVEEWFDHELWQDLSEWAMLSELQKLSDEIRKGRVAKKPLDNLRPRWFILYFLHLVLQRFRLFSVRVPWWSQLRYDKSQYTEPVLWNDKNTIQLLHQHFDLPPLRERYASIFVQRQAESANTEIDVHRDAESENINGGLQRMKSIIAARGLRSVDSPTNLRALNDLVQQYSDIFRTVFTMLEEQLGTQANRYRSRAAFHQNMRITTAFLFFVYASVALFRIAGGAADALAPILYGFDTALRRVNRQLEGFVLSPEVVKIDGIETDWLIIIGVIALIIISIIISMMIANNTIRRTIITVILGGIFTVGFVEFVSMYRSIVFVWGLLLMAFVLTFVLTFALLELSRGSHVYLRYYGISIGGVIFVLALLILFFTIRLLRVGMVEWILTKFGVAISYFETLVLGFVWVSVGVFLISLLWYLFNIWAYKYEIEYLRYLMATYHTLYTEPKE